MENEITAHRDGVVDRALRSPPGEPVQTGQVICVVAQGRRRRDSNGRSAATSRAGQRRAARRHGEPDRPLAPRRVPRALGPERAPARAGSPTRSSAPPRAGSRARDTRACSSSAARTGAARPELRAYAATSREGEEELRWSTRVVRGPARARPRSAGRAERPAALPRLHARQARPVLRALRPAALRGARRAGRRGVGLAGDARRRRPLRRQPRLPAAGRLLRARRARATRRRPRQPPRRARRAPALPRPLLLPVRRAGRRARRPRAGAAVRDRRPAPSSRRTASARRLRGRDRPADTSVDVRVELGPEDYLTCNSTDMRRPRRFVVSR